MSRGGFKEKWILSQNLQEPSEMADEKFARGAAKGAFTRARKALMETLRRKADDAVISAACDTMIQAYSALEEAHTRYIIAAKIDEDDEDEANYMDGPSDLKTDALVEFGEHTQDKKVSKEQDEKAKAIAASEKMYDAEQKAFVANIARFGKPSSYIKTLCDEQEISFIDM